MTAAKARLAAVEPEVDDQRIIVDMASLTAGEMETAEDLSGVPINYFYDLDKPKGKLIRALAFVVRRRIDPSFTWDQAADLRVFFEEDKPVPPTNGRGSTTPSRSRNTSD